MRRKGHIKERNHQHWYIRKGRGKEVDASRGEGDLWVLENFSQRKETKSQIFIISADAGSCDSVSLMTQVTP